MTNIGAASAFKNGTEEAKVAIIDKAKKEVLDVKTACKQDLHQPLAEAMSPVVQSAVWESVKTQVCCTCCLACTVHLILRGPLNS